MQIRVGKVFFLPWNNYGELSKSLFAAAELPFLLILNLSSEFSPDCYFKYLKAVSIPQITVSVDNSLIGDPFCRGSK